MFYGGGIWEYLRSKGGMTNHSRQFDDLPPGGGRGNRFGIIQLSDLQFGENHTFGNPSDIAERLLKDVKKMSREHQFTPVYMVLSGDITETGDPEEFQDAANVIEGLVNELKIPNMNILCIPGNHDVSRRLTQESESGNEQLKFQPYHRFVSEVTNKSYAFEKDTYPRITNDRPRADAQLKIAGPLDFQFEFLLLNSCEKIDRSNKEGYICPRKLSSTLRVGEDEDKLRIAILHHPLHNSFNDDIKPITNASQVGRILASHKYNIVLTGHVHQGYVNVVSFGGQHTIIFASCGSTGINHEKRIDGVQNQYCIHVIDFDRNKLQSIWRAYNPSSNYGLGSWVSDNAFEERNPTIFDLFCINRTAPSRFPRGQNETT